jgi:release factor glutamine methyltransferase
VAEGPSLPEVIRRSAGYLERHGVESARVNVETLLMHLLETDRASLYTRTAGLDTATAKALGRALCQRCVGVPLQHLTGEQAFFGLTLAVEPGVFVPRPETEVLVETTLDALDRMAAEGVEEPIVVDVGTGTGAVALAVAGARPRARVFAIDRNPRAVALARRNGASLGMTGRVVILEGDLLDPMPSEVRGRIDAIVSNPPYLTPEEYEDLPEEVRADPREALLGGTEVHRRLAEAARTWLRPGGWLITEAGADQGEEVRAVFASNGLVEVEVLPDLTGRDRVVRGRLSGDRDASTPNSAR